MEHQRFHQMFGCDEKVRASYICWKQFIKPGCPNQEKKTLSFLMEEGEQNRDDTAAKKRRIK